MRVYDRRWRDFLDRLIDAAIDKTKMLPFVLSGSHPQDITITLANLALPAEQVTLWPDSPHGPQFGMPPTMLDVLSMYSHRQILTC